MQQEISEMESLERRLLKKDGTARKDADQVELSRLSQLKEKFDKAHTVEFADDAVIETRTKEIIICVGGQPTIKRVPSDFQNKKK